MTTCELQLTGDQLGVGNFTVVDDEHDRIVDVGKLVAGRVNFPVVGIALVGVMVRRVVDAYERGHAGQPNLCRDGRTDPPFIAQELVPLFKARVFRHRGNLVGIAVVGMELLQIVSRLPQAAL